MASMSFNVFARDFASQTFDKVGDAAERLGRRTDKVGESSSKLSTGFGALGGAASTLGGHLAGAGTRLVSMAANVGITAIKLGAAAGAMASAASSASSLIVALAPAAGIIAALPGVVALGAAAMVTLKVALSGMGDAFKAALGNDPEKFEASLKGLSSSAQVVARELHAMKPALDGIKLSAQNALFAPLQGQLTALIQTLGGPIAQGMANVGQQFGFAGAQVTTFARSAESVAAVQRIFADLRTAVERLRPAIEPVLAGFRDLAVVGSGFAAGLTPGIADAATRFGQFLSAASSSGKALGWMQGARDVFKQLGAIAADVGGILSSVFKAMQTAGGGALGVIGQLLDGINAFARSAEGQQILVTIFQALHTVATAFLPVIKALAGAVGVIIPQVARLAQTVGPILAQAISAIAPAIAAIGPGLINLVGGIGAAVRALSPVLLPLGQAIGQAFSILAPVFGTVGKAIAGIVLAVAPLLPVVAQLARLILNSLASGVQAVLPSINLLVSAFSKTLQALYPVIPLLVDLAVSLINNLVPALAPLLPQIATLVAQLISGLVPAIKPLIPLIADVARQIGADFVRSLGQLIQAIIPLIPNFVQLATSLLTIAPTLIPLAAFIVIGLKFGSLIGGILGVAGALGGVGIAAASAGISAVAFIGRIIAGWVLLGAQSMAQAIRVAAAWVVAMGPIGWVTAAVVGLAALVIANWDKVKNATTAVWGWIQTQIGNAVTGIGNALNWFAGLPGMFSNWFGLARNAAIGRFNELVSWVRGIPGQIVNAIGNLGDTFANVGKNMIFGLWNGVTGLWGWFRDRILGFFRNIMPDWVRNALGIRSPSRLFAEIGKQLPAGMALGIDAASGLVQDAAQRLADMASVSAVISPAVGPVAPAGGPVGGAFGGAANSAPTFVFHFAGQPLIGRDEISRLVIAALNDAKQRGFNLGAVGA